MSSERLPDDERRPADGDALEDATTVTPKPPAKTVSQRTDRPISFPPGADLPSLPTVSRLNYTMQDELARGGMGRITRAVDVRLERPVAIKEILVDEPELLMRFFREIRITSQLQHPGIVSIYEAGRWEDGQPFFAMRMVAGESLRDVVQNSRGLKNRLALLPHMISVVEAMAYAHNQGVIHRDLKPANVLIGKYGEAVVIDWGLAKSVSDEDSDSHFSEPELTQADGIMGTPAYMSPEQTSSGEVDSRSDVYALGAMLYFVLTRKAPYPGQSPLQIVSQLMAGPPRPIHELQPGLPSDLVAIVEKAMERDPDDRYPSAGELAAELARFQAGQLVAAHSYTRAELVSRWLDRHRAAVAVTAVALAVLIAGGIYSLNSVVSERDRAEAARSVAEIQRARADERADDITLVQAQTWIDRDPSLALAWLRRLQVGSSNWSAARLIAAEARTKGIYSAYLGHEGRVWSVAFSPDGKDIASAGEDQVIRMWNRETGAVHELAGHKSAIRSVVFSPNGALLASADQGGTVRLWSTASQDHQVFVGHKDFVEAMAFSPDGRWLATGSWDHDVRLWDLSNGECHVLTAHQDQVHDVAFSPDGTKLYSAAEDGQLIEWSTETLMNRTLANPESSVTRLEVSADGERVVFATLDGWLGVIAANDSLIRLEGHVAPVTSLAMHPTRDELLSASLDGSVRLWNVSQAQSELLADEGRSILAACYSPDGRFVAFGGVATTIHLHDLQTGTQRAFDRHSDWILSLEFSRDGNRLASCGVDELVLDWNVADTRDEVLRGHLRDIVAMDYAPERQEIATGGLDSELRLWNLDTRESRRLMGHEGGVRTVAYSPDGQQVASGGGDKTVRLWDVESGESRVFGGHEAGVEHVLFSPDGKTLVSTSLDKTVRLWNVESGESRVVRGHEAKVSWAEFSPDGRYLASAGADGLVRLWEPDSGRSRDLTGHEGWVRQVRFSPDGRKLASAGSDETVRVWDVETGKAFVLDGHGGWVRAVVFSRDNRYLATASADHNVRIWNLQTHEPVLLTGHTEQVESVRFSADGLSLASTSADGTARVWDIATGYHRTLRGHASTVRELRFLTNRPEIVTASLDGTLRVWRDDLPRESADILGWLWNASNATIAATVANPTPSPTPSESP